MKVPATSPAASALAAGPEPRPPAAHAGGAAELVDLDPEHPGFRDRAYRARRNSIAQLALDYREGTPVPDVAYTSEEQEVWRGVWDHLGPLHDRHACAAYRLAAGRVALDRTRVPQLAELNRILEPATGFRMLPVAGLVSARMFLAYLARGVFLSTQYMRHHSRPLYTPEPDVIHELVGHAATFTHEGFAALSRQFGEAALRADDDAVEEIGRMYWFTLEFGVVREDGGLKACGAGLLSSFGELERFEREAELRPFDPVEVAATPYDPTEYQRFLYVASSFDGMVRDVSEWLADP